MQVDKAIEYAIEVPGRGYMGFAMGSVDAEPGQCMGTLQDAEESLKHAQRRFVSLGCADIAESLRIASRTVTVTRGDWE